MGFGIKKRDIFFPQPGKKMFGGLWRPATAVIKVEMNQRKSQSLLLKAALMGLVAENGIQVKGKNRKLQIASELLPSLPMEQGKIATPVGVQGIAGSDGVGQIMAP